MIGRTSSEGRKPDKREKKAPINGWFFGRLDWAVRTLKMVGDDQSVPRVFWTVRFRDRKTLLDFLLVWPNSRRVPVDTDGLEDAELGIWDVEDIVCFQWLRDRSETVLAPCVQIRFEDRCLREKFRAYVAAMEI